MSAIGFIYLIVIAIMISLFLVYVLRTQGPWDSFWPLLLVLFLTVWAADVWIPPLGPEWWGVYWARPLVVGLFVALLLAAASPPPKARKKIGDESLLPDEEPRIVTIGIFFWLSLVVIISLIIAGMIIIV